ncbi:type II toxin-antitoxin system PrlF family antitoxin [bacterium]|nr:type II toxin-antitoxin system PrlF family antitoxin [bacterium]MBU1635322.1 type II toxin-antitoxin system PrlF family antitoxin [bacterium]MBU1872106.1 type II toxin-antitoxin system PrlF family antitoxin [bacterium]
MKATITSKGQVTIPKPVRDFLNINKSDQIDFTITKSGKVFVEMPKQSIARHGGMLTAYKPDKALTIEQMDKIIQEELIQKVKP